MDGVFNGCCYGQWSGLKIKIAEKMRNEKITYLRCLVDYTSTIVWDIDVFFLMSEYWNYQSEDFKY